jgi:hypothetical protein
VTEMVAVRDLAIMASPPQAVCAPRRAKQYYRYGAGPDQREGAHTTVEDKEYHCILVDMLPTTKAHDKTRTDLMQLSFDLIARLRLALYEADLLGVEVTSPDTRRR